MLRLSALLFVTVFAVFGEREEPAPVGFVRGSLESVQAGRSGEIRIRSNEHLYVCRFDANTWVERFGQRVTAAALEKDDPVEMLTDRKPAAICYARTIRISEIRRGTFRSTRTAVETWNPRGTVMLSGVVVRWNPELLVLRTRGREEKMIVLRADTRYVNAGMPDRVEHLPSNTPVFIRAGKNFNQELEAYQVAWGRIAGP